MSARPNGQEVTHMLGEIIALVAIASLVVAPLVWRNAADRRQQEALRLQAWLQSKANHRLGGESLLVVTVHPPTAGQRGRVVLSVPARWAWLVGQVWSDMLEGTPGGYDLVVPGQQERRPAPRAAAGSAAGNTPLLRAG
jgi:hypothetical protein